MFKVVTALLTLCAVTVFGQSTRGRTSKNPIDAYQARVVTSIGPVWRRLATDNAPRLSPGTAHVAFIITPEGRAQNLRVVANSGNPLLAAVSIVALRSSKFPPIPRDVMRRLPNGRFDSDFYFTVGDSPVPQVSRRFP